MFQLRKLSIPPGLTIATVRANSRRSYQKIDLAPRRSWARKLKGRTRPDPAFWFVRKPPSYTLSACELNYPMQFFAASMNVQRI